MSQTLTQLNNEKQEAALLNISWRGLQEYRKRRLVPYIKLGKRVLYNHGDVMRALEKLTVKSI